MFNFCGVTASPYGTRELRQAIWGLSAVGSPNCAESARSSELGMRGGEAAATGISAAPRTPRPALLLHLARIEVGPAEMRRFLEDGMTVHVAEALKRLGYAHVTLDLQGYRRGSANERLRLPESQPAALQPRPHLHRRT